ncbi:uncharacterized protein LOC108026569 [Drosophila biarmipes]|uniref:uncharacterized protein LOC108026569 n=1 Tax=Drosophila biarmipes TaxID=125945 RepID=UPI0007E6D555|nr:uncharacterized protein LOC108026569 [Drosophila biarmipes]
MPKRNWRRSKCSVHLPRSKFVEIRPKISSTSPEKGPSFSETGPRMTLETLCPNPNPSSDNVNEASKEISISGGCLHTLKENTSANKVNEAVKSPIVTQGTHVGRLLSVRESSAGVSEWDERLLPSSLVRNKENKDHRKKKVSLMTGATQKQTLGGEGQGWKGFSNDVSLYKNLNGPLKPGKTSMVKISNDDDLAERKQGAIKKETQKPTGNPLKRSHSTTNQPISANPRQAASATFLDSRDAMIREKLSDPMWCNLNSEDFVFQQTLDNNILVKTVMPKFLTKLHPSTSEGLPPKDAETSHKEFVFPENQKKVAMETLMPELAKPTPSAKNTDLLAKDLLITMRDDEELPNRVSSREKLIQDPMWSSTFIRPPGSKKKATGDKKAKKESVWRKDNMCEVSMRDIMDPEVPPSSIERLRSVEAICMRLRGIDVPGNLGILQQAPTYEELFDVLNI